MRWIGTGSLVVLRCRLFVVGIWVTNRKRQRQRRSRRHKKATDVGGSVARQVAGSLGVKDGLVLFTFAVVVVVVVGVVGIGTPTGDDDSDMCSSDNDDYDGHATMAPVRR